MRVKLRHDIDKLPPDKIEQVQAELLKETVDRVYKKSGYYRSLYKSLDLNPSDIQGLEDLTKLPFTSREEISKNNWDFFSVDREGAAELVSTTGTTGDPVYVAMTRSDQQRLAYNEEKSFTNAGAQKGDLFFIDVTCDNLFIAGIAYYSGLIKLGASVVRVGAQNIARQFDLIKKLKPRGIVAVPSFIAQMARRSGDYGINVKDLGLQKIVLIGDSIRNEDFTLNPLGSLISGAFGNIFSSTYGITEGQVSFCECRQRLGLHSHPDLVLAEIIDDEGNPLPDGETGELVLTTLQIEGMPLVRYKTGDITFKISAPCECGSNSLRIGPVMGRKYHRLKFKGVTLYPKTIENAILDVEGVENYQIEAFTGDDHTDHVLLRVGTSRDDESFKTMLTERLRAKARVSPKLEIMKPEELSKKLFNGGNRKAITFIDKRSV
ncbi:MAG: AMP-binding protein [Nitrospirota bacterium]